MVPDPRIGPATRGTGSRVIATRGTDCQRVLPHAALFPIATRGPGSDCQRSAVFLLPHAARVPIASV